jgi:hypothetical protein
VTPHIDANAFQLPGRVVDRRPMSFWSQFLAKGASAAGLAEVMLSLQHTL